MIKQDQLWPGGFRFLFDDGLFQPGTDSFLLGSFPRLRRGERVCDLGAGTGLLDLLLLKKDSITMRKVWLERFVDEVDNSLSPVMRKRGVRLFCRAEQKRVSLEPDLVKSLLYNLIDNAAKAMDGEGIIAVSAIAIPGGCQFQVVDNGRGMEKSELTKITEAFYRVDKSRSRKQGGAGLGLALCKQIVELHNGTISFFSEPGKGTRVTVCLYGREEKK